MAGTARYGCTAMLRQCPQEHCKWCSPRVGPLSQCLPWGQFLRTWQQVARQHDAAEFLMHFLQIAQPSAYVGAWQARLDDPEVVTQTGPLLARILMEVRGPTLQEPIDHWHAQPETHALRFRSGLVLVQLERYGYSVIPMIAPSKTLHLCNAGRARF